MPTSIVTDTTAQQKLDRIQGLISNGYGPEHLTAAVLIAADPTYNGLNLDMIDVWDCDGQDGPSGILAAAQDLINDHVIAMADDGSLHIQPYEA